jgi:hypothetical protein
MIQVEQEVSLALHPAIGKVFCAPQKFVRANVFLLTSQTR